MMKKQKERIEELKNSIDFLEPSQMDHIRVMLTSYMLKPDDDP